MRWTSPYCCVFISKATRMKHDTTETMFTASYEGMLQTTIDFEEGFGFWEEAQ